MPTSTLCALSGTCNRAQPQPQNQDIVILTRKKTISDFSQFNYRGKNLGHSGERGGVRLYSGSSSLEKMEIQF